MSARPMFRVSRSYAAQATDGEWLSLKNRIWLWIALGVAFFVRVNMLAAQSLWNDEGTSVALARTSWSAIVNAAARDIHPPLYYLLLHVWIQGAGISEFALRFLSVLAGVMVVALTFRIAREFFDQDVAVIAAVLSALNPFQVYYAQETRMYIWVTLFACLSVWAMLVMLKPAREINPPPLPRQMRTRILALVGYIISTLAALYTNYYAFTLVLFQNLAFIAYLIWAKRERRPRLTHTIVLWLAAQILIALAYLPWLLFARASITAWPGISEPMTLWDMAWRIVSSFITGADSPLNWQTLLAVTYLIFFVGGLLPSRDLFRLSGWGIVTCALWAVVPLLAMYFISLSRPAYNPKFLLLATPGFLILVARGVSVLYPGLFLRERAPYASLTDSAAQRLTRSLLGIGKFLVGVFFAAGTVLALQSMYSDPRLQRDDYRGIVNYINAIATAKDAVVVNAPGQMDVVRYYYRGAADLAALPVGRPMNTPATEQALDEIFDRSLRVFGIFWANAQADPDGLVESMLNQDGFKAREEWHGNVRLAEYALPGAFESETLSKSDVRFGDEILLEGYARDARKYKAGEIVPLWLGWQTLKRPSADWQIFIHLLDARGQIISQRDAPLDNETGVAALNARVGSESRYGVLIPPGTPPGEYTLQMGLYHPTTGARLAVNGGGDSGDSFALGALQVVKTKVPLDALFLSGRVTAAFDTIALLGYTLERAVFQRGEFIPAVLYWQARAKPPSDLDVSVRLVDQGGNVIASARAFENYPTSRWDADEIVRDVTRLMIPADALTGEYKIVVNDGAQNFEVTRVMVR